MVLAKKLVVMLNEDCSPVLSDDRVGVFNRDWLANLAVDGNDKSAEKT